jgi:hypothetical protein
MVNVLAQSAVLVSLNISAWTPYKFDRQISDDVNSEHGTTNAGRWNKRLFGKGTSHDKVAQIHGKARQEFIAMTQPWLNDGTRILATKNYQKFTAAMLKLQAETEQAVESFLLDYPTIKDNAKTFLNGMYKEEDFPSVGKLRGKFAFGVRTLPVPTSDDFRVTLTDGQIDQVKIDLENDMRKALDDAMRHTVSQVADAVKAMAEKLKGYTGSKQGAFRDSLIENMRDLADNLDGFNLTGDKRLDAVIDRIKTELCTDDAKALRENEQARKDTIASAESIMADVEAMLV